jgi:hypothetical protein
MANYRLSILDDERKNEGFKLHQDKDARTKDWIRPFGTLN